MGRADGERGRFHSLSLSDWFAVFAVAVKVDVPVVPMQRMAHAYATVNRWCSNTSFLRILQLPIILGTSWYCIFGQERSIFVV